MDGNKSQRKPQSTGENAMVEKVIADFLSKPNIDKNAFKDLRNKIGDQALTDKIQSLYVEKYEMVEKRAKAFAQKILEKYGITNQPFSKLLLKAHRYADKYGLTDAEKIAFKRILEQELVGANTGDIPKVTTNMSKVLGDISIDTKGFGMKVSDADYRELQDILKMKEEIKTLQSQIILQSMSYNDCDDVAINGRFVPESGHNLACHVHPVVAALFLPKFDNIEHHFLYSNIANIVASRYNQEAFKTRPDYELFYNLVTDPADVVCDSRSPLKDLKNRCQLQKQLWQSVLGLRNGQYYNCDQLDLLKAIDMCRLNKYDTPDLVYGRYDGTIIKRLFAAFSFRPTLVLSVPSPQVYSHNPYFQSASPTVSTIPMINLRLPQFSNQYLTSKIPAVGAMGMGIASSAVTSGPISLEDSLQQSQLFFENGSLIMKNTQVIDSRGIVVFFVDRRKHNIDLSIYNDPTAMVALPQAIHGFERVNTAKINVKKTMKLGDDVGTTGKNSNFVLKSVVMAKKIDIKDSSSSSNQDIFVGSETLVSPDNNTGTRNIMKYDPMGAKSLSSSSTNPIVDMGTSEILKIDDVHNRGMIFIYKKETS